MRFRWSFVLLFAPATVATQAPAIRVVVSDSSGARIPFAVVQLDASTRRAASDSGVASFEMAAADSLKLVVRRIGYAPFEGWALRSAEGPSYDVRLARLPQTLRTVQIRAPSENRLYRSGFYERLEDRMKIPSRAEFFTPEDLDIRNASRVTHLLQGVSFIRIDRTNFGGGSASYDMANVVMGRGRCMATILLDGNVPVGLVEDYLAEMEFRKSPAGQARPLAGPPPGNNLTPVDQLVQPGSIAGVEVYATATGAPAELRSKAKRLNCPLVAIWTGPRQ